MIKPKGSLVRNSPRTAPYIWRANTLRKDVVFGELGKMRVSDIDEKGRVSVYDRLRVKSVAPKKLAFESCPSCMKVHHGLSRRCGECGESMVYFPRPSAARVFRQPKESRSLNTQKQYRTLNNESAIQGVKSSLAYYLYYAFNFRTSSDLINAEENLRKGLQNFIGTKTQHPNSSDLSDESIDLHLGALPEKKLSAPDDRTIILTCILALSADQGNTYWCDQLMKVKKAHGAETPYDAKLLKDCFINKMYLAQSLVQADQRSRS